MMIRWSLPLWGELNGGGRLSHPRHGKCNPLRVHLQILSLRTMHSEKWWHFPSLVILTQNEVYFIRFMAVLERMMTIIRFKFIEFYIPKAYRITMFVLIHLTSCLYFFKFENKPWHIGTNNTALEGVTSGAQQPGYDFHESWSICLLCGRHGHCRSII